MLGGLVFVPLAVVAALPVGPWKWGLFAAIVLLELLAAMWIIRHLLYRRRARRQAEGLLAGEPVEIVAAVKRDGARNVLMAFGKTRAVLVPRDRERAPEVWLFGDIEVRAVHMTARRKATHVEASHHGEPVEFYAGLDPSPLVRLLEEGGASVSGVVVETPAEDKWITDFVQPPERA